MRLHAARDYPAFMRLAVRARKNILVSGATGSGKTTWTKALIREIPGDERLVTIEDARELALEGHPNHVRLYYSKGDQGLARVTPKQLLECCLRMRPDRILLAELRAEEAFDYLRNVNSGHPGSITSVHATSAELAFEQLMLLVKQSAGGQGLARADIKGLLYLLIWESLLGNFVGGARLLSVEQYSLGIANSIAHDAHLNAHLGVGTAVLMGVIVTAVTLTLAIRRLAAFSLKGDAV